MFRKGGQSTALNAGGRRKVHTTFPDGSELVEEYEQNTGELVVRKRRAKSTLGAQQGWTYLYGEPQEWPSSSASGIIESSSNPVLSRKDTRSALQWRIRNLPYPVDVYQLSCENGKIVVRTSNKKYFKRIDVPEMELLNLPLEQHLLTWTHAHNTLIISYQKPDQLLLAEREDMADLRRMHAQEDGDLDCKQQ